MDRIGLFGGHFAANVGISRPLKNAELDNFNVMLILEWKRSSFDLDEPLTR
jgi:hypothetical protein